MQLFLNLMQDFFGIIESMYEVSSNPEEAAIFQMHKIQEVYEEQGNKARAITVFEEILEESSNPTIRNAAYLMLGDAPFLRKIAHAFSQRYDLILSTQSKYERGVALLSVFTTAG